MDERQLLPFITVVSSLCLLNVGLRPPCSPPAAEWNATEVSQCQT